MHGGSDEGMRVGFMMLSTILWVNCAFKKPEPGFFSLAVRRLFELKTHTSDGV